MQVSKEDRKTERQTSRQKHIETEKGERRKKSQIKISEKGREIIVLVRLFFLLFGESRPDRDVLERPEPRRIYLPSLSLVYCDVCRRGERMEGRGGGGLKED